MAPRKGGKNNIMVRCHLDVMSQSDVQ